MAYVFPSIVHRLESYLIALEGCDLLGLTVKPELALEAMTKDSDNTEEHKNNQIHLQRGMYILETCYSWHTSQLE